MKQLIHLGMGLVVLISCVAALGAKEPKSEVPNLPSEIAKSCGTPVDWVRVGNGREVEFQLPPDAKYGQVDCILAELRRQDNLDLGFIGNEADPNQVISPSWAYIAGGRIETLQSLALEVSKAGWVVGSLAKADDGTGYLLFSTPNGMTLAQAEPFNARIWNRELGDITFGTAPTKTGNRDIGDD